MEIGVDWMWKMKTIGAREKKRRNLRWMKAWNER